MGRRKAKKQFLSRPRAISIRFNTSELREIETRAKRSRLSRAEYARRKMLELPIEEMPAAR